MNYGVATADGGMLAHKGETMNETLTDEQLEAMVLNLERVEFAWIGVRDVIENLQGLIAALRASREWEARYEAALREVALPCHDFDCDERPAIARAALGEEAT